MTKNATQFLSILNYEILEKIVSFFLDNSS